MKRVFYCSLLLLLFSIFGAKTNAQSAYSMHTIATGETLSALAKNYHTTVGDIMRLNGMNSKSQLTIGDKIKIPASGTVVAEKPAQPASAPVATSTTTAKTHVVEKGETLYRLSKEYNISVAKLIQLNHLDKPITHVGQNIIISDGAAPQTSIKTKEEKPLVQPKETKTSTPPSAVASTSNSTSTPEKDTSRKTETAQNKMVTQPAVSSQTTVHSVAENSANTTSNVDYSTNNSSASKEGFFTTMYGNNAQQKKEQNKSGAAMTFKSASGWSDKKYYILMNDVPTGSIVKISNGKNELYAKVLWNLSEMKENDGLQFRISTAAAATLGITDQKFDLKVSYYE